MRAITRPRCIRTPAAQHTHRHGVELALRQHHLTRSRRHSVKPEEAPLPAFIRTAPSVSGPITGKAERPHTQPSVPTEQGRRRSKTPISRHNPKYKIAGLAAGINPSRSPVGSSRWLDLTATPLNFTRSTCHGLTPPSTAATATPTPVAPVAAGALSLSVLLLLLQLPSLLPAAELLPLLTSPPFSNSRGAAVVPASPTGVPPGIARGAAAANAVPGRGISHGNVKQTWAAHSSCGELEVEPLLTRRDRLGFDSGVSGAAVGAMGTRTAAATGDAGGASTRNVAMVAPTP